MSAYKTILIDSSIGSPAFAKALALSEGANDARIEQVAWATVDKPPISCCNPDLLVLDHNPDAEPLVPEWVRVHKACVPVLFVAKPAPANAAGDGALNPADPVNDLASGWRYGRVLAAVNVVDPSHDQLNLAVLKQAAQVAKALGAELHVVTTYPRTGSAGGVRVGLHYRSMASEMRRSRARYLHALALEAGATEVVEHVVQGSAVKAVNSLARSLGIDIAVYGLSTKTGLQKWLVGSTADDLIRTAEHDVLLVGPRSAEWMGRELDKKPGNLPGAKSCSAS